MSDQIQFFPGAVKKATEGCKSSDLWKVPPAQLRRHPGFNVRQQNEDYDSRVRALADSMKENGYYADKPMAGYVAREGEANIIIITDGHTRLDAVELAISEGAQIEVVPVVTKPAGTSMEDLTVALVTGNTGSPLKPYEVAIVCKRLVDYGMDEETIARRLGYTPTHVQNLLLLMAAPAAIRNMVAKDKISASLAVDMLKKHGPAAADVLKAASKEAGDAGGGRVTAKQVTKAREKRGDKVVKLAKPVLLKSVTWLKENELLHDPAVQRFLGFLGGFDEPAQVQGLIDKLLAVKKK